MPGGMEGSLPGEVPNFTLHNTSPAMSVRVLMPDKLGLLQTLAPKVKIRTLPEFGAERPMGGEYSYRRTPPWVVPPFGYAHISIN